MTVVPVKAGNACPKAHTTNAGALPGQKVEKMRYHFRWSPSPAHAHMTQNNCATLNECEWPILEPTRMASATLSTLTELERKIKTNSV